MTTIDTSGIIDDEQTARAVQAAYRALYPQHETIVLTYWTDKGSLYVVRVIAHA